MSESNKETIPASKTSAELGNDPAVVDTREPVRVCLILDAGTVAYLDSIATQSRGHLNRSSAARGIVSAFSTRRIRYSGARTESDIGHMTGRALDHYLKANAPRPPANTPSTQAAPERITPRTPQASVRRVEASNGKTVVASTIPPTIATALPPPVDKGYEARFEQLYNAHPIAGFREEAKHYYIERITSAMNPDKEADAMDTSHPLWLAYWRDNPDGHIPSFSKWIRDNYYLKTPQAKAKRAFPQNYAEGGR